VKLAWSGGLAIPAALPRFAGEIVAIAAGLRTVGGQGFRRE
jgi:hypothetical protein